MQRSILAALHILKILAQVMQHRIFAMPLVPLLQGPKDLTQAVAATQMSSQFSRDLYIRLTIEFSRSRQCCTAI